MIKAQLSGEMSLYKMFGYDLVEDIASATAAKTANEFANYVRDNRFNSLYNNKTGETKDSIGVYRLRGKNPVFASRAGLGVRGNLNYLAGLYRGYATSRSGNTFSYDKPRDLITTAWRDFGGEGKINQYFHEILQKRIKEAGA